MDIRVLGSVEAFSDGTPLPLGATKQRALFAMLVLEANRPVSADRLIEGLWGESPPPSAAKNVQLYVSQLRRALRGTDATIATRGRGYELTCDPDAVDLVRVERLLAAAAAAADGGTPNGLAREALALWRGPALADVAGEPFAAAEVRRCEELWLRAQELAIEADLAAGRHDEALQRVAPLAAEHRLHEHIQGQHILALYRAGRQAEALEAYRTARERLVEEIGSEPGPELRALHEAMLHQDPALDAPPRAARAGARAPSPPRPRRRMLIVGGVLLACAALAVLAVREWANDESAPALTENSLGLLDPASGEVSARYAIGRGPSALAVGAGSVWVANELDGTVTRIDRERDQLVTIDVGPHPTALAFGAGSLWVVSGDDQAIAQVDPVTNRVARRIPVGGQPAGIAVGFESVWVTEPRDDVVVQLDLARGAVTRRIGAGAGPTGVAVGAGGVWVTAEDSGHLVRVDPGSGVATASVPVGNGPGPVAVGEAAVWVANRLDGTVSRVELANPPRVVGTVDVGTDASALAAGDAAVWVADSAGRSVVRVEPATGRTEPFRFQAAPTALAAQGGDLWVTAIAPPGRHRGGTLRVESEPCDFICANPGFLFAQTVEMLSVAYDGLVGYRRAPGTAGETLVPALATSVPEPQDNGLRYVFTLRPGLRFSDGRTVHPTDVRASLERSMGLNFYPALYSAIRGAPACVERPEDLCDLSRGVVADDAARTVTLRLSRPDPEILHKLTLPPAAVLPSGTPDELAGAAPPAGTGPYRLASIDQQGGGRLVRNRYFTSWSPEARPEGFADEIVVRRRNQVEQRIGAVENGQSDLVALDNGGRLLSQQRVAGIETRYPSRVVVTPRLGLDLMFLNVHEPPFDDVRVRRAVNLATDRERMVEFRDGPARAEAACQAVPPSVPGFTPYCPYTRAPSAAGTWTAPDLAAARRLIAASGTRGMRVQVWTDTDKIRFGRYFERLLARLGYRTSLRVVKAGMPYFHKVGDSGTHAQIGMFGWIADYARPSTFFDPLFSCNGRIPASPDSSNPSQFCSRDVDAAVAAAQNADGPAADAAWAKAQRLLSDLAPAVPLSTHRRTIFSSARAGNVQQNPMWGTLLERVWVR